MRRCYMRFLWFSCSSQKRYLIRCDKISSHCIGRCVERPESAHGCRNLFSLFLVLICGRKSAIYYLSADLQNPAMFKPRKALGADARRAGWQGFSYLLKNVEAAFIRIC